MIELFFVLCAAAVVSASSEYRTRDRQTLVPYPIPFSHVADPYSDLSPTSVPYVFQPQLPSPYSSAWPYPSRPYSTSGPFKYNPSPYDSPGTYSSQPHDMYKPPPSYWPYPTQVFYASQYYPQSHPPPPTPPHHVENNHNPPHPSPIYSTAKPLTPHNSYHIEIPQHTDHNQEESPLHPQHSPNYHNTHEDSNHGPSHVDLSPLHPHPHHTPSHHSVYYPDAHGETNSNPYYSTHKPSNTVLTTEHLLQYLQNNIYLRKNNPFPPPPQPPRVMILHPLETHSGGVTVSTSETSGGSMVQSQLPPTRRNTEAGEGREDSPRAHVLWETMYRPIRWDVKWHHKWNLKNFNLHHLWNTKWPQRWMPGTKETNPSPQHDPHLALEPWDHVTVRHPPPLSNPYYGFSHDPHYPSKASPPHHYQLEDYFEHPHTLDTYLQHDEPWSNKHLLETLLQDNKQAYQHTRDPAQYYHYNNKYSLPGRRQFSPRPSSVPWVGAQRPDAPSGDPEGRLLADPPQQEEENPPSLYDPEGRLLADPPEQEEENPGSVYDPEAESTADQRDVETPPQPSRVDDDDEDSSMLETDEWPPRDVETLPPLTSSEDLVLEARPRASEVTARPWLPPSYFHPRPSGEQPDALPVTSRDGRSSTITRGASLT